MTTAEMSVLTMMESISRSKTKKNARELRASYSPAPSISLRYRNYSSTVKQSVQSIFKKSGQEVTTCAVCMPHKANPHRISQDHSWFERRHECRCRPRTLGTPKLFEPSLAWMLNEVHSSFAPPSVTLILYFCCKWRERRWRVGPSGISCRPVEMTESRSRSDLPPHGCRQSVEVPRGLKPCRRRFVP